MLSGTSNSSILNYDIDLVRNKFTDIQEIMNRNTDVVSIAEAKIGASFPSAQFFYEGCQLLYCLD